MRERATNDGMTTVRLDTDSRETLKVAAARRRVTMATLLAELIAPLADEPAMGRRKPARKRDRVSA
jgi:predicted DNA-binding ribbon-helix-helix protein